MMKSSGIHSWSVLDHKGGQEFIILRQRQDDRPHEVIASVRTWDTLAAAWRLLVGEPFDLPAWAVR